MIHVSCCPERHPPPVKSVRRIVCLQCKLSDINLINKLSSYAIRVQVVKQMKYIVMITKEGYTKIVNFLTLGAPSSYSRVWPYKSYWTFIIFYYIIIQDIDCYCVKELWCAALICHCWFLFILWFGMLICKIIWALLTKGQCIVSDTQVTFKAFGALVLL